MYVCIYMYHLSLTFKKYSPFLICVFCCCFFDSIIKENNVHKPTKTKQMLLLETTKGRKKIPV